MLSKQRTAAILLVAVLCLLTACAGGGDLKAPTQVEGTTPTPTQAPQKETQAAEAPETEAPETEAPETEAPAQEQVTVSQTVIYDTDGVKVTVTGYEDSWMGPELKLLIENNSKRNVLITADAVSVNGYMMSMASLYAEVATEKKANEALSIMETELEQAGIDTVANIQFYVHVQDAEDWDTVDLSPLVTVETSASAHVQPVDDTGDVLYDAKGIKIVCKGLRQDMFWDGTVVFYMENTCGRPITVYAENVSVNGFMEDAGMWSDLRDGTRIVDGMSLLDLSDLEIESIDEVEEIEFNLRIIDSDNWDEIGITDAITLSFS